MRQNIFSTKLLPSLFILFIILFLLVGFNFFFPGFTKTLFTFSPQEEKEGPKKQTTPELDESRPKLYENQFYEVQYLTHWKAIETSSTSTDEEDYAFFVVEFSDSTHDGKLVARFLSGPGTGRSLQCWTRISQEKSEIVGVEAIRYYYHPLENRVADDGRTLIPCSIGEDERLMILEFTRSIPQYTEYSFEFYGDESGFAFADEVLSTFRFSE